MKSIDHTPIVFSTDVSRTIKNYYKWFDYYNDPRVLSVYGQISANQSFLNFIEACENENKNYLTIILLLAS